MTLLHWEWAGAAAEIMRLYEVSLSDVSESYSSALRGLNGAVNFIYTGGLISQTFVSLLGVGMGLLVPNETISSPSRPALWAFGQQTSRKFYRARKHTTPGFWNQDIQRPGSARVRFGGPLWLSHRLLLLSYFSEPVRWSSFLVLELRLVL